MGNALKSLSSLVAFWFLLDFYSGIRALEPSHDLFTATGALRSLVGVLAILCAYVAIKNMQKEWW